MHLVTTLVVLVAAVLATTAVCNRLDLSAPLSAETPSEIHARRRKLMIEAERRRVRATVGAMSRDGGCEHLRLCLSCGNVGCCDSSPRRHATAHFHATDHPVIRSAEPGESWQWCYVDELTG